MLISPRMRHLAIAALGAAWISYLWWGHWGDAQPVVWVATAIPLVAGLLGAAIGPRAARAQVAIVAVMFFTLAGFAASRVLGRWPFAWDAMPDARYAGFIAGVAATVAIGLLRGALWARWTAMAFSAANIVGGGLNSIGMRGIRDESAWLAAMTVVGSVTIWSLLASPTVRARFTRGAQHALWTSSDRMITSVRWAAIANFAAGATLLLYALAQPIAPRTVVSALVLAPVLGLGSVLVVARRASGVVILALGGAALLAQTLATAHYVTAGSEVIVGYYAAFWVPTAIVSLTAGALALRRVRARSA